MVVDMTGTPSVGTDAEGNPTEFLASKLRDSRPDLAMRSEAAIDPAIPTLDLATARDGSEVPRAGLRSSLGRADVRPPPSRTPTA